MKWVTESRIIEKRENYLYEDPEQDGWSWWKKDLDMIYENTQIEEANDIIIYVYYYEYYFLLYVIHITLYKRGLIYEILRTFGEKI